MQKALLSDRAWEDIKAQVRLICRETLLPSFLSNDTSKNRSKKPDGSWVTETDVTMQQKLLRYLRQQTPDFGFIGEEMPRNQQLNAMQSDGVYWIADPLDGTNNFTNGIPFFATALALVANKTIVAGVVYTPIQDELFHARIGQGAFLNDTRLDLTQQDCPEKITSAIAFIDFKRIHKTLKMALTEKMPFGSHRNWGSTALEISWLAANRGHLICYSNQHIWDYAAAWLILSEAGGVSCDFDGNPVPCFSSIRQTIIAATNQPLHQQWCKWIEPHK